MDNILLLTDSYKASHYRQYPKGTTNVYSYFESRGGKFPSTMFFGLQYFLKKYLLGVQVTEERIQEAKDVWDAHLGPGMFNEAGWRHILEKHGGKLPVSIRAVPEGTRVTNRNVLMTIENTDPECFWLTNYLETLLVQVWYPSTVATQSFEIKRLINSYLEETGNPEGLSFKLHDFGFRGVSSVESAAVGGAAHLVNFMGTDTVAGLLMARKYYGAEMPGFSIPASEHSTITSWGKDGEVEAFRNMLEQYPTGLVACVSDSFDIYKACRDYWGGELRDQILNRDGTLVVRPDSGEPKHVVREVLAILGKAFGLKKNFKGYDVLPDQIRVIQGDGVNIDSIKEILAEMKRFNFSADNIAFGMGGALLQRLDRDTQSFAFKCSSIRVNGEDRDVYKQPVTSFGKKSKAGRFKLVQDSAGFSTVQQEAAGEDLLIEVFRDGELLVDQTFNDVRERAVL